MDTITQCGALFVLLPHDAVAQLFTQLLDFTFPPAVFTALRRYFSGMARLAVDSLDRRQKPVVKGGVALRAACAAGLSDFAEGAPAALTVYGVRLLAQ